MPDFTMCADSHDCPRARDCQRSIANSDPSPVQSWALFLTHGRCREFMPLTKPATPVSLVSLPPLTRGR